MINRLEILEFAREVGLSPEIVEKDYVLGWLLGGISNHPALQSTWLFKGGTCLKKCYFKGIPVPDKDSLANSPQRAELESEWENMLAHQLPEVPPLASLFDELPRVFSWLSGLLARAILPVIPAGPDEDASWRPPAMVSSWGTAVPLEIIRFAAANHLCVDLSYQGIHHLIEPYSLRRTRDGNIILHASSHDSGDHRSYRVDRIGGASATRTSFMPRYTVELSPSDPLAFSRTAARPHVPRTSGSSAGLHRPSSSGSAGANYVIQCTYCGRRFRRKSYDTALKPHKDRSGYSCPGRKGFPVETKY